MNNLDREFAEFIKQVNWSMGLDPSSSELVAILYIEPCEISLEELAKRTHYSLAAVSMKLKTLQSLGIVTKSRKPGSRKAFFYMEKDISKLVRQRVINVYQYKILPAKEYVPRLVAKYKAKGSSGLIRQKLYILTNYLKQIEKVERVLRYAIDELDTEDK